MGGSIPWRRNFALILALESLWAFGTWLAHPMTVMPNFLLRLGATPVTIGLLPGLWAIGTGCGALAAGAAAGHRRRLASWTGWLHLAATLPWLGLAAIAASAGAGRLPPRAALPLALACLLAFDLMMGIGLQLYFVLLARVFPERGRGRWFGALFSVSSLVGLAGPLVAAERFIPEHAELSGYAGIFLVAWGCFVAGTLAFFLVRERAVPAVARRTVRANLGHLWRVFRANHPLRRYLGARAALELGALSLAFYATYARAEAGLSEHRVTQLGLVVVATHAVASLVMGWLTGRLEWRGAPSPWIYLRAQAVAQGLSLAILLFAALGPAGAAAWFLAGASGLRISAEFVLHPNILLETGGRRARLDHVALGAVVLMPATLLFPQAGGWAIELAGHRPVFAVASLVALPALRSLWRLAPHRRGGGATLARL